ncbi:MAG: glycosyltransferase family 2 protein [Pseudomonadota bacterium]
MPQKKLKISIITVSYNNEKTIADTIRSVKSQTYSCVEHIIIDGASTDNTMVIVNQFKEHLGRVLSEPDEGIYYAMNKGIEMATGDVIGFINADDILASDNVLANVAKTLEDENLDSCYANLVYVKSKNLDKVVRFWKASPHTSGSFSQGWSPPHPTFYVKKKIYQQFGYFNLNYKMGNDIELMMRFLERYHITTTYVAEVWVKMRFGGVSNNSIKNIFTQNYEIYRSARKNHVPFFVPQFIVGKIKDRIGQYLWHKSKDKA